MWATRTGTMDYRRWAILVGLIGLGLGEDDASAEKKKKAGLFDFESWKSPVTRQREAAHDFAPGTFDLTPAAPPATGGPRVVRFRVYADRDFRSAVLRWQVKVRGQFERINKVVGPVFGARFEIESLREWDRSHQGAGLPAVERELDALDPARDVDWVVGLVTPFRGVATSMHQVGLASLLSRSFVLRGMDDEQEGQAIERELRLLSGEERDRLYSDRKAHKEIICFLHEWAHTMGALHVEEESMIMNPAYDPRGARFSEFEKALLAFVLDRRLARRAEPHPESAELRAVLEGAPPDEGSIKDRAELLALAQAQAGAGAARAGAASASAGAGVAGAGAGAAAPASGALAEAVAHAQAGELTAAEAALARVDRGATPAADKIAAELDKARRRLALPRDAARFGVKPEDEAAYAEVFWKAARAANEGSPLEGRRGLELLAARFPNAPGVDVVACDVELRARHAAAAGKRCQSALAKFDEAVRAHLLLGTLAARAHKEGDAESHLRQVIKLDADDPEGWRALARFYRASRSTTRLDTLEATHRTLFGRPLPE